MGKVKKDVIAFDFDGVIHRYSKGWYDGTIYDSPVNGIKEVIEQLKDNGYKIVIFTTRAIGIKSKGEIRRWLQKYDIPFDEITNTKPIAKIYVDDRAINFNGNTQTLLAEIFAFSSWIERTIRTCPVCGTVFTVNTPKSRKKYCSENCKIKANR